MMSDLAYATATSLAARIRERRVSAIEVLEAMLARIERHNPALTAIVTLDAEGARRRAAEADAALARGEHWGALHGVPMTIKDAIETAGMRTTSGFPPLADYVPSEDASVVTKLRAAGAIIVGKTNLPVMAGDAQCDNPIFGRTNNPWDLGRTPGGNSGGSAAALAAGITPLEIGSDLGGSIRIPAHFCGVTGLRPTDGRVPLTGHIPEPPGAPRGLRHMCTIGPMARSIDDLYLALRVIAGPDGRNWETPPVPLDALPERPLAGLRVVWSERVGPLPASADTRAAIAGLATSLAARGAQVEQGWPERLEVTAALECWGELLQSELGSSLPPEMEDETEEWLRSFGDDLNPMQRGRARRLRATMRQYTETLERRDAIVRAAESIFDDYDVLLCPVTSTPAIRHCPGGTPVDVDGSPVDYSLALSGSCSVFNLTGQPVVVIPIGRSSEGLPIGVQIVGRRWSEPALLAAAAAIAAVLPAWSPPPAIA